MALALSASGAGAAPIREFDSYVDIHVLHGWFVWSERGDAGYRLTALHDGVEKQLPVKPRHEDFDLDLGTDRHGRAVATFSRCTWYPRTVDLTPFRRRACSIRIVDLAAGHERAAGEPRPRRYSDMWPSMWRGRIAFTRFRWGHDGAKAGVGQVYLWSPVTGRLVKKRHGSLALCSRFDSPHCDNRLSTGWVQSMDLGDRLLAFTWYQLAPEWTHPEIELRADDAGGHSYLAAKGIVGEGYGSGPSGATVRGRTVWFQYGYVDPPSGRAWFMHYDTRRCHLTKRRMDHLAGYARDGSTSYGLFGKGSGFVLRRF